MRGIADPDVDDDLFNLRGLHDGSVVEVDALNALTAERDGNINVEFMYYKFATPNDLYTELSKYIEPKDEISSDVKLLLEIYLELGGIAARFYSEDNGVVSNVVRFGAAITDDPWVENFDEALKNYVPGLYDENGLIS